MGTLTFIGHKGKTIKKHSNLYLLGSPHGNTSTMLPGANKVGGGKLFFCKCLEKFEDSSQFHQG